MKTSQIFITFGALLSSLALVACTKKDSSPASEHVSGTEIPVFTGVWVTPCAQFGPASHQTKLIIEPPNFTQTSNTFSDATCNKLDSATTMVGTFRISGIDSQNAEAYDLDIDFTDGQLAGQKGYTIIAMKESVILLGTQMGLNPASRGWTLNVDERYSKLTVPQDTSSTPSALDVSGIWSTGCIVSSQMGHHITEFKLTADSFEQKVEIFSDELCANSVMSVSGKGTYKLGGLSVQVEGAHDLDLHVIDDLGAARDLYDIVSVQGDVMYFGISQGLTPDSRPQSLNRDEALVKKAASRF